MLNPQVYQMSQIVWPWIVLPNNCIQKSLRLITQSRSFSISTQAGIEPAWKWILVFETKRVYQFRHLGIQVTPLAVGLFLKCVTKGCSFFKPANVMVKIFKYFHNWEYMRIVSHERLFRYICKRIIT